MTFLNRIMPVDSLNSGTFVNQQRGLFSNDQPDDPLLGAGGGETRERIVRPVDPQAPVTPKAPITPPFPSPDSPSHGPIIRPVPAASSLGDSGLLTGHRIDRPVPTSGDSGSGVPELPREPLYADARIGNHMRGVVSQAYNELSIPSAAAGRWNPAPVFAQYLQDRSDEQLPPVFTAWWRMMDSKIQVVGPMEDDTGRTNPMLALKTETLICAASNTKLASRICGFVDFLKLQYNALVSSYPITDKAQHQRLLALLKHLDTLYVGYPEERLPGIAKAMAYHSQHAV